MVGEPAQESSEGHTISSLRHIFRWIPTVLGLKKPSYGEDDGRISFRAIALGLEIGQDQGGSDGGLSAGSPGERRKPPGRCWRPFAM
jgi:hypothetical protein